MYFMRSVCFGLIFLCVSALCQTSPPPPSPAAVFQRARARLLADTKRMPRYTCEQNIVRYFYRAKSSDPQTCATILAKHEKRRHDAKPVSWDRLQLDVAIADDGEVHSWPGAPRFNEEEIRKLVNNGPFGSGDFSAFVSGIFAGGAAIKFDGSRSLNRRTLFAYTFAVPKDFSHYRIATGEASLITAYDGSFLLDPQTADLTQLTVRTSELPEATRSCQALSQMDYGRIDIHGREVLIPSRTDLRMIYRDGREAVATTSYSNCHEYTSKAVLHFDEPAARQAVSRTEPSAHIPAATALPEGLAFDCRILTPIDSDTSAGLPIEAILRSPLRDKNKTILAPRGAHIHGRLVRLADHKGALDYFEVGVRLESIELNGAEVPLHARLADQAAPPINYLSWDDRKEMLADFPAAPPRNVGIFFFVREKLHLLRLDSQWTTTSPETGGEGKAAVAEGQKQRQKEEIEKLIRAINYSQKAIDLQNAKPFPTPGSSCDLPNLDVILANRRQAVEVAKSANTDVLNELYSGLGEHFKHYFIESLDLFVHGCGMPAQFEGRGAQEVAESRFLWGKWADWYGAHRKAIEGAAWTTSASKTGKGSKSAASEVASDSPTGAVVPEPAAPTVVNTPPPPAPPVGAATLPPVQNPAAGVKQASSFPSGALIVAALAKALDVKKAKIGDKVEARTTTEAIFPGFIELPRGTRIQGHVSNVKTKSKGSPGSMVELVFDRALTSDGRELPLQATLQAVGRPLVKAPAAMDNLIVSPGASLPVNSAPSGDGTHGMAPPPSEPPQVGNPDSGMSMPGEQDAGALTAKSQGIVGLQGLSLSASTQVSIISSAKGNVRLDGGTQLILRTQ